MKSSLLIQGDSPFCFQPDLAKAIGLNEAIVLQQLSYLLSRAGNGREFKGERWIFNTYEQWQKEFFPFWSVATIQRTFAALEDRGFVASCQPEGTMSRRKYYRLGGGCALLNTERLADASEDVNDDHSKLIRSGSRQIDTIRNVSNCDLPLTENTSEKTTEIHTAAPTGPANEVPTVKAPKKREPNLLLESLASVGGANPRETPPKRWSAIQMHLREIKAVTPDVTPDEIRRREAAYRRKYSTAAVTPDALAKHWAEFPSTRPAGTPVIAIGAPEPLGWQDIINREFPSSKYASGNTHGDTPWSRLSRSDREMIAGVVKPYLLA